MDYILFKNRSYRGVISKGLGLYFTHFRLFFKASWLMAIVFALVFAAFQEEADRHRDDGPDAGHTDS